MKTEPIKRDGLPFYRVAAYHKDGMWMFDDPEKSIVGEPFVDGMDDILDHVARRVKRTFESRARIWFDFSDYDCLDMHVLVRGEPMHDGYWYHLEGTEMRGWICPCAKEYFPGFPEKLYFRTVGLKGHINEAPDAAGESSR